VPCNQGFTALLQNERKSNSFFRQNPIPTKNEFVKNAGYYSKDIEFREVVAWRELTFFVDVWIMS
jgi:hypothetical protein